MPVSAAAPSRFPKDGSALDLLDKQVSGPIFRLQLGVVLECLLSVPGCAFGMPAFHTIAPTIMAFVLSAGNISAPMDALVGFGITAAALLAFWAYIHFKGSSGLMHHLHGTAALLVSPAIGMTLLLRIAETDARARNSGLLYLILWYLSILPVLTLKSVAGRRRPVASDPKHIGDEAVAAAARKALSHIPAMHKEGDANSSFPSGDVAGVVAFAYPLLRCSGASSWQLLIASTCIGLSAFGRMYFQAHHLMDVTMGGACALLTGLLFEYATTGFVGDVCTVPRQWWEPAVAFALLVVWAKSSKVSSAAPGAGKKGK